MCARHDDEAIHQVRKVGLDGFLAVDHSISQCDDGDACNDDVLELPLSIQYVCS